MRCKECKFWVRVRSGGNMADVGTCVRYPPVRPILTLEETQTYTNNAYQTYEFDWCGEWKKGD